MMVLHCIEPYIITLPSARYDLDDIERNLKHQIIPIIPKEASLWQNSFVLPTADGPWFESC